MLGPTEHMYFEIFQQESQVRMLSTPESGVVALSRIRYKRSSDILYMAHCVLAFKQERKVNLILIKTAIFSVLFAENCLICKRGSIDLKIECHKFTNLIFKIIILS